MNLLEIGPDLLSLEFSSADAGAVRERLGRLGQVRVEHHATHAILTVAGEEFIHMDEWDDPCLIARTPAGSALLRFVVADDQPIRLAS